MDYENILLNSKIIKQIENDTKNSLINDLVDKEEKQQKEMTNMLNNILKKILDSKLCILEKNSKKHFSILNQTSSTTKYITNITSKMSKEIKSKLQRKKSNNKLITKSSQRLNINQSGNMYLKTYDNNSKNQNHSITNRSNYRNHKYNISTQRIKNDFKSKSPLYGVARSKKKISTEERIPKSPITFRSMKLNIDNNDNNQINYSPLKKNAYDRKNTSTNVIRKKKNNIKINPIMENFSRESVISNGTNNTYTYVTSESSPLCITTKKNNLKYSNYKKDKISIEKSPYRKSSKKNIGLIGRMKKNLDKNNNNKTNTLSKRSFRKQSDKKEIIETEINNIQIKKRIYNKKELLTENNNNSGNKYSSKYSSRKNNIESQNTKLNNEGIIDIETDLKEEAKLINEDPLLISSIKDLDFSHALSKEEININLDKNNSILPEKKYSLKSDFSFKIETTFSDENLKNILVFLSIKDILSLKNCSKAFHKSVIDFLIKKYDIERNYFIQKQNELNLSIEEIPNRLSINNLTLTKGAVKAINLLNEEILNRIFIEEKSPNKEIIIVYKIYFQLINHEDIIKTFDITDKNIFWNKCKLYFREYGGKTGDLLNEIISQKKIILNGEIIYKVYKLIQKNINKIYPAYYSKICGTTGLFVFFIKDVLDFLGFSNDKKIQKNAYWSYSEIINFLDSKINILNKYNNY